MKQNNQNQIIEDLTNEVKELKGEVVQLKSVLEQFISAYDSELTDRQVLRKMNKVIQTALDNNTAKLH